MYTDVTVMSLFASSLDAHQKAKGNPKLEFLGSSGKGSLLHLFGIYARTVTLGVLSGVLFWLVWCFVYVVFKTCHDMLGVQETKQVLKGPHNGLFQNFATLARFWEENMGGFSSCCVLLAWLGGLLRLTEF